MPGPICHINLVPHMSGDERQTELLIRGVAGWGVKQRFIGSDVGQLAAQLEGVKNLEIITTSSPSEAASASKGSCLIHAHEPSAISVAHRAHFFRRTPYMITHREQLPPSGGYWMKRSYHKSIQVIAVSKAIKNNLQKYSADLNARIIPSCASAHQTFATTVQTLEERYDGKFVIGHVGSLIDARKGQSDLLKVAKQVESSHPEMHFVFIGVGPDEKALKEQAKGLANVEFLGGVKNIGDYLSVMSVFAYPSRQEGFGATLLDAMDYSVPVVATAIGGVPELIHDGVSGLLVSAGNVDQLAFAIQRLHGDRMLGMRLAQAGHKKAQDFTPEAMTEQHLELYQPFLG